MTDYWPWWLGAIALAFIAVAYPTVVGRRLGVSSAWERVVHWRSERATERLDRIVDDEAEFEAALAAATTAEFGGTSTAEFGGTSTAEFGGTSTVPAAWPGSEPPAPDTSTPPAPTRRMPLSTQPVLLVSILVGGFLAAVTSGRFEVRTDMGPAFSDIVVDGPLMWPVLFVGGLLVGFGTRMAGGCSSGHGLSGCSRLEPVSIVATAVFFGTAVATSFLLWKVI